MLFIQNVKVCKVPCHPTNPVGVAPGWATDPDLIGAEVKVVPPDPGVKKSP